MTTLIHGYHSQIIEQKLTDFSYEKSNLGPFHFNSAQNYRPESNNDTYGSLLDDNYGSFETIARDIEKFRYGYPRHRPIVAPNQPFFNTFSFIEKNEFFSPHKPNSNKTAARHMRQTSEKNSPSDVIEDQKEEHYNLPPGLWEPPSPSSTATTRQSNSNGHLSKQSDEYLNQEGMFVPIAIQWVFGATNSSCSTDDNLIFDPTEFFSKKPIDSVITEAKIELEQQSVHLKEFFGKPLQIHQQDSTKHQILESNRMELEDRGQRPQFELLGELQNKQNISPASMKLEPKKPEKLQNHLLFTIPEEPEKAPLKKEPIQNVPRTEEHKYSKDSLEKAKITKLPTYSLTDESDKQTSKENVRNQPKELKPRKITSDNEVAEHHSNTQHQTEEKTKSKIKETKLVDDFIVVGKGKTIHQKALKETKLNDNNSLASNNKFDLLSGLQPKSSHKEPENKESSATKLSKSGQSEKSQKSKKSKKKNKKSQSRIQDIVTTVGINKDLKEINHVLEKTADDIILDKESSSESLGQKKVQETLCNAQTAEEQNRNIEKTDGEPLELKIPSEKKKIDELNEEEKTKELPPMDSIVKSASQNDTTQVTSKKKKKKKSKKAKEKVGEVGTQLVDNLEIKEVKPERQEINVPKTERGCLEKFNKIAFSSLEMFSLTGCEYYTNAQVGDVVPQKMVESTKTFQIEQKPNNTKANVQSNSQTISNPSNKPNTLTDARAKLEEKLKKNIGKKKGKKQKKSPQIPTKVLEYENDLLTNEAHVMIEGVHFVTRNIVSM